MSPSYWASVPSKCTAVLRLLNQNSVVHLSVTKWELRLALQGSAVVTNSYEWHKIIFEECDIVIGHEYCDCSTGSDTPLPCPDETVFCDLIGISFNVSSVSFTKKDVLNSDQIKNKNWKTGPGACVPILGEACSEEELCCAQPDGECL